MRIDFNFEPDDPDLQPFRDAWLQQCERRRDRPLGALAARALSAQAAIPLDAPAACRDRLAAIPDLVALLIDPGWPLPSHEHARLSGALAYFCERMDLIPDDASHFGLLDDAIVLAMALSDCAETWCDWREYRAWREACPEAGPLDRRQWHATRDALLRDALRRARLASYLATPSRGRYAPAGAALDFPEAVQFGLH
ncbi:MAG: YkvA family protein [Rehaibacterium terrae]|uniref:YkvA family protein n=1 Tax=Rehaibacterium terrae TaxID=1341696 RepID=UPI003919946E